MRALIGLVLFMTVAPDVAGAQSFDLTTRAFVERFNSEVDKNGGEKIKSCGKPNGDLISCNYENFAFSKQIKTFKSLDLINGNFPLLGNLDLVERGGKIGTVIVSGDRGDPANFFHYMGQVDVAIRAVSNKEMSSEDSQILFKKLGLMRGDSDPTIGQKQIAIESFAAISCIAQPSSKTTKVACMIEPRF